MKILKEKKNPNYILENRKWISVKRHIPVVFKAVAIGIICIFMQYLVFRLHFAFNQEAENAILFLPIAFAFFVYVIFSGYAINKVLDESKIISRSIVTKDLDTFLIYRDEQLPILIHLPLGVVSFIIIFFALFFPFPGEFIAATAVFSIAFIMALLFMVTKELDNYESSIWFREKIPQAWWDINIEDHFKEKNNK